MKPKPFLLLPAALMLLSALPAHSQSPANPSAADPFLKSNQPLAAASTKQEAALPKEGLVRVEVFTLSRGEGHAATRKFPKQSELYAWLGGELEKENAKVKLERLMVLRVRGGQRSKLEEIAEYPYPSEIDAPEVPQTVGIGLPAPELPPAAAPQAVPVTPAPQPGNSTPGAKGETGPVGAPADAAGRPAGSYPAGTVFSPWPYTAATPQAFTHKNTGWTLEIELTIADDGQSVDLNMAPEFIRLCGLESQSPNGEVLQPNFETSKIATQVQTKFGLPTLAGTFSPPVEAGLAGGNTEPLTRLLFVTVTNPR